MEGWGGSCRGEVGGVGHVGVMVGHVWWSGPCRGGVGHVWVGWVM